MESLYRKYRPQTFETVVGQKHIVGTLRNALVDGRVAHAYLFSGPRGTGKTTMARLLAKALLCEHGPTASPDGTCEQCEAIASGTHPDVYELDAASRTGVDNVREEIINRVAFAPTLGRKKIYIIDEVHMLTNAAFNALLKTLEEPPAHVLFVMCTTDPQKVPDTILSRCQRLEFHRITSADIEGHLAYVCEQEGFAYDREALALIAKHARGGMRDALSLLEQLSVFGNGRVVLDDAQNVLGEVSDDALAGMMRQAGARDVAACFSAVADLIERGVDIARFARDLTSHARDMYVASVAGPAAFADRPDAVKLAESARAFGGPDRLSYALEILGQLENDLRTSVDQRLALEIALARIARPTSDLTLESLAARVEDLERRLARIEEFGLPAGAGASRPVEGASEPAPRPVPQFVPKPEYPRQPQAAQVGQAVQAAQVAQAAQAVQAAPERPEYPGQPQAAQVGQAGSGRQAPQPQTPQPQAAQTAAGQPTPAVSAALDSGAQQRLWNKLVEHVLKTNVSVGALVRNMSGELRPDGVLVVENHGSTFAAQMLMRAQSMDVVTRAAAAVYGRPVRVELAVNGMGAQGQGAQVPKAASPQAAAAYQPRSAMQEPAVRQQAQPAPAYPEPASPRMPAPADSRMTPPWEPVPAAPAASPARATSNPPAPDATPMSAVSPAAPARAASSSPAGVPASVPPSAAPARAASAPTAGIVAPPSSGKMPPSSRTRLTAAQIAQLASSAAARVEAEEAAARAAAPAPSPHARSEARPAPASVVSPPADVVSSPTPVSTSAPDDDRVPDDVYDAYDEPDGSFGFVDDGMPPQAGFGAGIDEVRRPEQTPPPLVPMRVVPVSTPAAGAAAPVAAPVAPGDAPAVAGDLPTDSAAFELQQMLSDAFGELVRVSEE